MSGVRYVTTALTFVRLEEIQDCTLRRTEEDMCTTR
jgi:hypothetical protein